MTNISLDKNQVMELATEIKKRVSLKSEPIGVSLIKSEDEIPKDARRPSKRRGLALPVCLAWNLVRTEGWTVALTLHEHFCTFAAAGLGHIALPEYLQEGKMGAHHTRTKETGKALQERYQRTCFFEAGSTIGIMMTPATDPMFIPQGLVIYGNPSQIGKIAKAITWFRGEPVSGSAGGIGGCIVAAASIRDKKPIIVMPSSGEKILGHTEENDIFLTCPIEMLPAIVEGLKATDYILPYPTVKYLLFEPKVPKNYPIDYLSYRSYIEREVKSDESDSR
jgi:uncharacterized protein (DUF169 family)